MTQVVLPRLGKTVLLPAMHLLRQSPRVQRTLGYSVAQQSTGAVAMTIHGSHMMARESFDVELVIG